MTENRNFIVLIHILALVHLRDINIVHLILNQITKKQKSIEREIRKRRRRRKDLVVVKIAPVIVMVKDQLLEVP